MRHAESGQAAASSTGRVASRRWELILRMCGHLNAGQERGCLALKINDGIRAHLCSSLRGDKADVRPGFLLTLETFFFFCFLLFFGYQCFSAEKTKHELICSVWLPSPEVFSYPAALVFCLTGFSSGSLSVGESFSLNIVRSRKKHTETTLSE